MYVSYFIQIVIDSTIIVLYSFFYSLHNIPLFFCASLNFPYVGQIKEHLISKEIN